MVMWGGGRRAAPASRSPAGVRVLPGGLPQLPRPAPQPAPRPPPPPPSSEPPAPRTHPSLPGIESGPSGAAAPWRRAAVC